MTSLTVSNTSRRNGGVPDEHGPRAIGLDVGGTKIAAGVVTEDGQILDHELLPTPLNDETATVAAMQWAIQQLRSRHRAVGAIGVGAAGLVEWPDGRIIWAPNNSYRQLPLRQLLHESTGLPTVVDNDANAATWAEAKFGAGAGRRDLVLLTIGTGIGGGLLLGGELYRGRTGLGAEIGHIIVDPDGTLCGCGNAGCLEAMASGSALGRKGRAAAAMMPDGRLAILAGGHEQVNGEIVFKAALDGDPRAVRLFDQIGFWLGVGVASLVNIFDPEIVIIAGGLVAAGDLLLTPTRDTYRQFAFAREHRELAPIVPARLGAEAGMVGAASLALHAMRSASLIVA